MAWSDAARAAAFEVRRRHLRLKTVAKRDGSFMGVHLRQASKDNRVWMAGYLRKMRRGLIPYQSGLSKQAAESTLLRNMQKKRG